MRAIGGLAAMTLAAAAQAASAATFFPADKASDACVDTPLTITAEGVKIGTGNIVITDLLTGVTVETIDVAAGTSYKDVGGLPNFRYYPVIIDGNDAHIYLKNHALQPGHTYSVHAQAGALTPEEASWGFTTRGVQPAPGAAKLTVAADGTGDFATVQGAIDFVPDGNKQPVTISIKNGTYRELIFFTGKNNITLTGEDRKKTIIDYANNDKFNNQAGGNPFGTPAGPTTATATRAAGGPVAVRGAIYHRGVFLAHRVQDLTISNLTIRNSTPQGGTQAEALILNGLPDAHAVVRDVDLYSYQDTLQINGQAYLQNCYIEGDVDFLWGTGPCFFEQCEAKELRGVGGKGTGYYAQIRNPPTHHGYVFDKCTFDGAENVSGNVIARIDATRFPGSEMVLVDCTLTPAVGPVAWKLDGTGTGTPALHFWEYNSKDASGKPVDVSGRLGVSRQMTAEEAAQYRDVAWVLGGWKPQ